MSTYKHFGLLALGAAWLGTVGCNTQAARRPTVSRNDDLPAENLTPASRMRPLAEQIAQARCEREQQCGNIGGDKTFSSPQDCLARIQNDWKEELSARECPSGISQHELDECLKLVREEACANPFDTLARITECTSRQICN
jgi:hypothetical protein